MMPDSLPRWVLAIGVVAVAILILWAASAYLDAATALLPGGEDGGFIGGEGTGGAK